MIDNALFAPVTDLKGVGTKTAAALGSLGIYSIYDLLFYFPFRYDELQTLPLDQIMDGQKVMLKESWQLKPLLVDLAIKRVA